MFVGRKENVNRVVVTGAGVVSALGKTRDDLYESLRIGKSAVRLMPEWSSFMQTKDDVLAAPVDLSEADVRSIDRRCRRSMSKAAVFAALAARDAVAESGLSQEFLSSGRVGCAISSTVGSASAMYESCKAVLERRFEDLAACQFLRLV